MLGWVAAVRATESPSQLSPALIHKTWMTVSSGGASVVVMASTPWFAHGRATRLITGKELLPTIEEPEPPVMEPFDPDEDAPGT